MSEPGYKTWEMEVSIRPESKNEKKNEIFTLFFDW